MSCMKFRTVLPEEDVPLSTLSSHRRASFSVVGRTLRLQICQTTYYNLTKKCQRLLASLLGLCFLAMRLEAPPSLPLRLPSSLRQPRLAFNFNNHSIDHDLTQFNFSYNNAFSKQYQLFFAQGKRMCFETVAASILRISWFRRIP